MNEKTQQFLNFLASRNVHDGVCYEPRLKTQLFDFKVDAQVSPLASDDATFLNNEQDPVRITHLVAAIRDDGTGEGTDPRLVQRFGLRIRAHDTYYMNDQFVQLPLWANRVVAATDVATRSLASWVYGFGAHRGGFFMGDRDNLEVKVALEYAVDAETEEALTVWVTFHGVGAISRRPKQLTGFRTFTAADGTASRAIAPEAYRNDGTEPLEITEMTIHVQAADAGAGADPTGNIRRVKVLARQNGNGTNQRWTSTPAAEPGNLVPAALWGLTTGRAIVHELPKNDDGYPGWLWYPDEGLTLEVMPNAGLTPCAVYIGLVGHIVVK